MDHLYYLAGHRCRMADGGDAVLGSLRSAYASFEEPTEREAPTDVCPFCRLVLAEDWQVRFGSDKATDSFDKAKDGSDKVKDSFGKSSSEAVAESSSEVETEGERLLYRFFFPEREMKCAFLRLDEDYLLRMRMPWQGQKPLIVRYTQGANAVTVGGAADGEALHFALWFAFALLAAPAGIAPVHASAVVWHGYAVLILGESGTGKSTHTRLWCNHIEGAWLLNDDSPLLAVAGDAPWVYGSPWSGKTPCYHNVGCPLRAVVRLEQASANVMQRLRPVEAVAALQPSCPPALVHDEWLNELMMSIIQRTVTAVPVYRLRCLPNADAARLCFHTLFDGQA